MQHYSNTCQSKFERSTYTKFLDIYTFYTLIIEIQVKALNKSTVVTLWRIVCALSRVRFVSVQLSKSFKISKLINAKIMDSSGSGESIVNVPPYFRHLRPSLGHLPTILLFRHAEREQIFAGVQLSEAMNSYHLTDKGRKDAEEFGTFLRRSLPDMTLELVISSPVERCLHTVRCFLKGLEREDMRYRVFPRQHTRGRLLGY